MKKHIETLIDDTKTRPQETFEFRLNKQLETFFSTPRNLSPEKWLIAANSFETANFVFNISDKNISFAFRILGSWVTEGSGENGDELKNLLEVSSDNEVELYVEEVGKRGNQTKLGEND